MSISEAFILGLLQAFTEFLPISSSGHLIIASYFLGLNTSSNLFILVLFHLATVLSIFLVFRKDIFSIGKSLLLRKWDQNSRLFIQLLISAIPIFFVGVFFKEQAKSLFSNNILLVAAMLFLTALLLFLSYYKKESTQEISYLHSFLIGIAQVFAILPGLSRSGVTITLAILLGCGRKQAVRFSFLMLLLPVAGASFLEILASLKQPINIEFLPLLFGFLVAFLVGSICCVVMKKLTQKNKLIYFSFYCLGLSFFLFIFHYVFY